MGEFGLQHLSLSPCTDKLSWGAVSGIEKRDVESMRVGSDWDGEWVGMRIEGELGE